MITSHCQRWRDRRGTYRVIGEPICTRKYEVSSIGSDHIARKFVVTHHYSGSYVAARMRIGLYRASELVGIAVLSQPASQAALHAALPFPAAARVELGRFVLLDDVPANGESWFLARCFALAMREGFDAVVAHSDPETRRCSDGRIVFPGHAGTIYQSTNAVYVGRTPARTWRLFSDGSVFSARTWSKLRGRERGWQYATALLVAHGAPRPEGDWQRWVRTAVDAVTRPMRHYGTHRYLWALKPRLRRQLPAGMRYPKIDFHRVLSLDFIGQCASG
jgi:hypothetical protein